MNDFDGEIWVKHDEDMLKHAKQAVCVQCFDKIGGLPSGFRVIDKPSTWFWNRAFSFLSVIFRSIGFSHFLAVWTMSLPLFLLSGEDFLVFRRFLEDSLKACCLVGVLFTEQGDSDFFVGDGRQMFQIVLGGGEA